MEAQVWLEHDNATGYWFAVIHHDGVQDRLTLTERHAFRLKQAGWPVASVVDFIKDGI
jgi:hypothetical protein